ncbi:MAG: hypothetical protein LQ349_008753 [Xanthoria aureola]|nr:MAG: hypothetical protein LQ349_008753 [Xanthoria aureola]
MDSTLRSRPTATTNPKEPTEDTTTTSSSPPTREYNLSSTTDDDERISRLPSLLDIFRLLLLGILLSTTLSYFITSESLTWNYRPPWTRPARIRAWLRGPITLTPTQLSLYNGTSPHLPIYLALNASIYDVTSSPHLYGPGGPYHFFSGRDATRAFITGCFTEDLTCDVRGVEEMFVPVDDDEDEVVSSKVRKVRRERDLRVARRKVEEAVEGWRRLFDGGKGGRYFWVGRVVGGEEEEMGEVRALCRAAREGRPKRGKGEEGGKGRVRRAEDV